MEEKELLLLVQAGKVQERLVSTGRGLLQQFVAKTKRGNSIRYEPVTRTIRGMLQKDKVKLADTARGMRMVLLTERGEDAVNRAHDQRP